MALIVGILATATAMAQGDDRESLGRAIDYFQGGKYHESLLIFQRLDKQYRLNPRYKAYIGLCYFKEFDYENASDYIDKAMDDISVFAPAERTAYYFADAESHFFLQEWRQAMNAYEKMLTVCHDNEKADALYRLGLCHMQNADWAVADEYFESAAAYYERFGATEEKKPRMAQIRNMQKGIREKLKK